MITKAQREHAINMALNMFRACGIVLSEKEIEKIDVADFGLGHLEAEGAQIAALADTERLSIRLIALFPGQTEPEHWHTAVGGKPGKEEIIRVMDGTVYFYLPGEDNIKVGKIPGGKEQWYTSRNELVLESGDQLIIEPSTRHWFQAGSEGTVLFCFCSAAADACDPFSDPSVVRLTQISN